MIRRSTWIVLIFLLALIGLSFYLRGREARELAAATPTEGVSHLFAGGEGAPTMIRVEDSLGVAVEFSRDEQGIWVLNAPESAAADQAVAEAAATQVDALRVLSTVDLAPDIIGLDSPAYTISLAFGQSIAHKLLIGAVTPISDGYYVQLDDGPYQVVDKYGLDELTGLLTNPPYLATPTPVLSATPLPLATPTPAVGTAPQGGATGSAAPTEQLDASPTP